MMDTRLVRTYTELSQCSSLEERFDYLRLDQDIGLETFGSSRWVNQRFYHSKEWRDIRYFVIARDEGFDLGAPDTPIRGRPYIHHMNPLTLQDIEDATENLLNPEYLISVSLRTHNGIHFGDKQALPQPYVERRPGDTTPWR